MLFYVADFEDVIKFLEWDYPDYLGETKVETERKSEGS